MLLEQEKVKEGDIMTRSIDDYLQPIGRVMIEVLLQIENKEEGIEIENVEEGILQESSASIMRGSKGPREIRFFALKFAFAVNL